ncbi:sugar phosphate isomerase/epimerase family protein [Paenibacillus allorhizosphaerae]|uniref:Xylose isomerase-like TIM barrel domain-containing protein n=1 Tax=Paenibacillus allorhizosphaerae TaxID=2849866 RepID=A0ABM8VRV2_9BACL|nr:sugar phosphate isomerase/epimerase family protein [Paenibacillus allorhizosphaerae]CAG7655854.1 hypothetical protein PAECIP111802_06229 [Paenibacillus allorhizosphaerae]
MSEAFIPMGCCLPSGTFMPQGNHRPETGRQHDPVDALIRGVTDILQEGYDFAELTVGSVASLTEVDYERLAGRMNAEGLQVPVFNSFIPPRLKLTGLEVDEEAVRAYVEAAVSRTAALGAEIIVFGSGGARSLPEGFSAEHGREQIRRFLQLCDTSAAAHGVTIAIEPLNRKECNVINTVAEALVLAKSMNLPQIRVLADAYHMRLENEPMDIIRQAAADGMLAHVHYAEADRSFPCGAAKDGIDLESCFRQLAGSGYEGRISAECFTSSGLKDCGVSLEYVKKIWNLSVQQR